MNTSILIGRLLAVVYVTIGLGMLIRPNYYRKMMRDITQNAAFLYFGGIMALIVGLLIVMHHNVWTASWTLIITIIGWLALVKGVSLLIVPDLMLKQFERMMSKPKLPLIAGVVALTMGLVLGYFSFCSVCCG